MMFKKIAMAATGLVLATLGGTAAMAMASARRREVTFMDVQTPAA